MTDTIEIEIEVLRAEARVEEALVRLRAHRATTNPTDLLDQEVALLLDAGDVDAALDCLDAAMAQIRADSSLQVTITLKQVEILLLADRRDEALDVLRDLAKTGKIPVAQTHHVIAFLLDLEKFETAARLGANPRVTAGAGLEPRLGMVLEHRRILAELGGAFPDEATFEATLARFGQIDGFYHNFRLRSGRTLFDVAPIKMNSPVETHDFTFREWDLICQLPIEFAGKRVLDVGGADGFFSIESARAGAAVTYLAPDPLFLQRAKLFAHHFGVEDKIEFKRGLLQHSFLHLNGRYDLVLALGLIYHLDNLALGLRTLMELSDTLVIETATGDVSWTEDRQAVLFKDHDPLDFDWVVGFFERHGYGYVESTEWAEYVNRYPKSAGRRLACFSRR